MTDDANREKISVRDLLNTLISRLTGIEDTQRKIYDGQNETNVHLERLNGTVAKLQERSTSHSRKLHDQAGVLIDHTARLAVVERVTELRDAHQEKDILDARSGAWEARVVAGDAVGWFRQAAVTAVMVLLLLLLVGGGLVLLVFG